MANVVEVTDELANAMVEFCKIMLVNEKKNLSAGTLNYLHTLKNEWLKVIVTQPPILPYEKKRRGDFKPTEEWEEF